MLQALAERGTLRDIRSIRQIRNPFGLVLPRAELATWRGAGHDRNLGAVMF